MNTLLNTENLDQYTEEIAKRIGTGNDLPDVLPIENGGTSVTTIEEVQSEVTGYTHPIYMNDSVYLTEFPEDVTPLTEHAIVIGGGKTPMSHTQHSDYISIGYNAEGQVYYKSIQIGFGLGSEKSVNNGQNIYMGYDISNDTTVDFTGYGDIFIGHSLGRRMSECRGNIGIGSTIMNGNTGNPKATCSYCTCVGDGILAYVDSAYEVTAMGSTIAYGGTYEYCTLIGGNNLSTTGHTYKQMTAVGSRAMGANMNFDCTNSTAIGYYALITGNNQVQLGNNYTTAYAYGAVQNRSDARDKANITPLQYDYKEFIKRLQPRQFQWDLREDYMPDPETYDKMSQEEKEQVDINNVVKDGSHVRTRRHNGFIAQEVKQVMDTLGFDFAGYQDHSMDAGKQVLSIGYNEFIAPMIACIQDLMEEVDTLKKKVSELENK